MLFQKLHEAIHSGLHEGAVLQQQLKPHHHRHGLFSDLVIKRMDRAAVQFVTLHIIFRHMRIETNCN